MDCGNCKFSNPEGTIRCQRCGTALPTDSAETSLPPTATAKAPASAGETSGAATGWSVPQPRAPSSAQILEAGGILAGRYEILQMLGKGGMGAVFKARDRELDRLVAIKVIRPELAEEPEILQRFKQELILARQITHRNVIRIFDLGQADGIKFITMEYVEGQDLKHILARRGKFPPEEAVSIVRQICLALDAAHAEGVIHRDLKPQNVMIDGQGKAVVMDFGIARSLEAPGATQTGLLIGTPDYMSPEQAKSEKIDIRSDLFTLGLIFYELLTGQSPFKADTAMGTLLKRIQERAIPPAQVDASISPSLSEIVVRCLAVERSDRYQTAKDVLRALDDWQGITPAPAAPGEPAAAVSAAKPAKWLFIAAALLLVAAGSLFLYRLRSASAPAANFKPVTILISDFDNATADQVFDGALESTLALAMEGASFITSYRRGDARKVATQLQPGATRLNENLAKLVARREGIGVIVSGSISRRGNGYVISVRAIDPVSDKLIVSREEEAKGKEEVLALVGKLATPIRKALGDASPESTQAALETFSAGSIEAAHEYSGAQELQWAGKAEEAISGYLRAVQLDPNLGRAYAGLAAASANLGRAQDSARYYRDAMAHIDRMSEREKYRTYGGYYIAVRNADKAIEELANLVRLYPSDSSGFSNLAFAYSLRRDLPRALEMGRKAVAIYPKNLLQRNNVAIYAMYAGDFETAEREARSVLEANPAFLKAHVVVALSELARGRADQAAEEYHKLDKISGMGASSAAVGLADLSLYLGRPDEAAVILEKQISADLEAKNINAAALKTAVLASAQLQAGRKAQALTSAEQALKLGKSDAISFEIARLFVETGQEARAHALASDLSSQLLPEPQAYGKIIEGELKLKRGGAKEAAKLLMEAQRLVDTWIGRFDLGRAYLEDGAFTEAHSELELCLKRSGEATALYLDEVPTYRVLPPVYFYLGRVHDGLKSADAPDSYKSYLTIKKSAVNDPMAAEARRLLGGR